MTKPLSAWKYYRNNQQKVALVLTIVALSAFLQYTLLVYMATWLKLAQALEPFNSNIYVYAQKSKRSQLKQLLAKHPAISKVFPLRLGYTSRPNGRAFVFSLHAKDMNPALNALELTLIKGRLPAGGTREIALHWRLAALKGLKIGAHFGRQYSGRDYLKGDYKLVGLLDGDLLIGFFDLTPFNNDYHLSGEDTGFLVIPYKGQFDKVVSFLGQCAREDPKLYIFKRGPYIETDLFILNALYLAVTSIVTICVSFLFYIFFYQRRFEFHLLEALGYTRQMIVGRALFEISGISLAGLILGVTVGLLSGHALNRWMYVEQGQPLELWGISYPFKLLSTPLVIILSGLLIVRLLLKKTDPISTIEGEV